VVIGSYLRKSGMSRSSSAVSSKKIFRGSRVAVVVGVLVRDA
jgi:hypothetical protein